ncbi:MAG TPA: hypothetical protein PKD37_08160 [Oligoflexia bacterium]|nr:hypothetical protein [Oligoflexia bacterium]HMP27937.1 hypothetical protein [Oligoflexia bacterium]
MFFSPILSRPFKDVDFARDFAALKQTLKDIFRVDQNGYSQNGFIVMGYYQDQVLIEDWRSLVRGVNNLRLDYKDYHYSHLSPESVFALKILHQLFNFPITKDFKETFDSLVDKLNYRFKEDIAKSRTVHALIDNHRSSLTLCTSANNYFKSALGILAQEHLTRAFTKDRDKSGVTGELLQLLTEIFNLDPKISLPKPP